MDTSDPEINFNEKGKCNHCNDFFKKYKNKIYHGEESDRQLEIIVNKIKNTKGKNKYDCLIGMSGGVDSSYVAYKTVQLGLNPLAVHVDNGWDSEESVKNIKNVCNKLNIDYQSYVLNWEAFKDIQLSILKSSIVEVEIPTDIAIVGATHKIASENNIKFIISGGNLATEGILPYLWFYDPKDLKLLKSIQKRFGKNSNSLKSVPSFDYKKEIYYKFFSKIRQIYILNYLPYKKEDAIKTLENKVNWKNYGGKHHESVYTRFVQSYYQPVKFDLDYRKATFSTQICTGEITREYAVEELRKKPYDPEKIEAGKEYVAKKLGITLKEFEEILNSPPKSYKDYPNNEKKLKFIYGVYKRYFYRLVNIVD
jgi:N-acetyl sugar amidotransferase